MLTTSSVKDPKEREVANETISQFAASSEGFVKSIMVKVEEALLSGQYDVATCQNFIRVISNVPGDSNSSMLFFETICKLFNNLKTKNPDLMEGLEVHALRAMLRMAIKVPLLFESTFEFVIKQIGDGNPLYREALSILSRAYSFSENEYRQILKASKPNCTGPPFELLIAANQLSSFGQSHKEFSAQTREVLRSSDLPTVFSSLVEYDFKGDLLKAWDCGNKLSHVLLFSVWSSTDRKQDLTAIMASPHYRQLFKQLYLLICRKKVKGFTSTDVAEVKLLISKHVVGVIPSM